MTSLEVCANRLRLLVSLSVHVCVRQMRTRKIGQPLQDFTSGHWRNGYVRRHVLQTNQGGKWTILN